MMQKTVVMMRIMMHNVSAANWILINCWILGQQCLAKLCRDAESRAYCFAQFDSIVES